MNRIERSSGDGRHVAGTTKARDEKGVLTIGYATDPHDGNALNEESKGVVSIEIDDLQRHVCILGRTGSGKSFTGLVLAHGLYELGDIATVILDRTGEFASSPLASLPRVRVHTPGINFAVSPFARRREYAADDVERGVSLIRRYILTTFPDEGFSPLEQRALRDVLDECYRNDSSSLYDVMSLLNDRVHKLEGTMGWREGTEALIARLTPIASGSLADVFDSEIASANAADFLRPGLHIVNLGVLETDEGKNMLSQVVCRLIVEHGRRLKQGRRLRLMLIVDEAHHIAPRGRNSEGFLETVAVEMSKYGMGLIIIAGRPRKVSDDIIANCNTIICHSLTSNEDIDLALNYMDSEARPSRLGDAVRRLDVGECFVQTNTAHTRVPLRTKVGAPEKLAALALNNNERQGVGGREGVASQADRSPLHGDRVGNAASAGPRDTPMNVAMSEPSTLDLRPTTDAQRGQSRTQVAGCRGTLSRRSPDTVGRRRR